MALIEDLFKGSLATGLAIGAGALLLGPTAVQTMGGILRPAAKAAIKGAMVFYRESLAELGEMASDLVAEARAELEQAARDDGQAGSARRDTGSQSTE
jgi:hypothetical protein